MRMKFYKTNFETNTTGNKHMIAKYRILYKIEVLERNHPYKGLLKKATRFITNVYQDKLGPSGSLYIEDLLEVAIIVAVKFHIEPNAIIAILLQDTLKDQKISAIDLRKEFNDQIADIVITLTSLAEVHRKASTEQQGLTFKPVLSSFSENNLLIVLIKLAECLHHMRMLDHMPTNDQSRITEEAKHIYIPLTHILGLNNVQLELENLCLKFQDRGIYETLAHQIQANKATNPGFLDQFIAPIYAALQQNFNQYTLKARTKSIASIWHKIEGRKIAFEDINDLYAIRIVFDSEPPEEHINCWFIYELVTTLYEPRLDRLRDWITYPKDNGYEALHITVLSPEGQWVEIQIRTTRMDKQAEHGHAAHWKYKDHHLTKELADADPDWFDQAREFLTHKWTKHRKTLDIQVDDLYNKSST